MQDLTPALALAASLALAPLGAPLAAQRATERATERERRPEPAPAALEHGTYTEKEFLSEAMERPIPYGIFLPQGYDAPENRDRRYPLVVWLHGMWEDHKRFHSRGGSQALDELIGKGEVPELILVSPSPGRTSFYINGKTSGRAEDLVVRDLLGHLEATYRLEPGREHRAIMGVSMGGMAALKIALKHPQLFGTVATHSAAIFPADLDKLSDRFKGAMKHQYLAPALKETFGDPIDPELWRDNNPLALVERLDQEALGGRAIYFDAGTRDRYEFHLTNQALDEAMTRKGIPHTWRLIEGGGHSWGSGLGDRALHDSLRFVAQQFAKAAGRGALRGLVSPGNRDGSEGSGEGPRKKG
jgi:S-formylglutathione hydrolase FrmB